MDNQTYVPGISKSGNPTGEMQYQEWRALPEIIDCNHNHNELISKKLREVTVEEGQNIAAKLFQILNERKDGIGLAANQVGIDAAVAVVNVREPIVLINPKIIDKQNPIRYYEGCLSFPGNGVMTQRYETVEYRQRKKMEHGYLVELTQVKRLGAAGKIKKNQRMIKS